MAQWDSASVPVSIKHSSKCCCLLSLLGAYLWSWQNVLDDVQPKRLILCSVTHSLNGSLSIGEPTDQCCIGLTRFVGCIPFENHHTSKLFGCEAVFRSAWPVWRRRGALPTVVTLDDNCPRVVTLDDKCPLSLMSLMSPSSVGKLPRQDQTCLLLGFNRCQFS